MDGIFAKLAEFYGVRYTKFRRRLVWALSFFPASIALFMCIAFGNTEAFYDVDFFSMAFAGFLFVWVFYWILKFVIRAYPKE
jgi:hypothetical protein